jgi:hypothetical protein
MYGCNVELSQCLLDWIYAHGYSCNESVRAKEADSLSVTPLRITTQMYKSASFICVPFKDNKFTLSEMLQAKEQFLMALSHPGIDVLVTHDDGNTVLDELICDNQISQIKQDLTLFSTEWVWMLRHILLMGCKFSDDQEGICTLIESFGLVLWPIVTFLVAEKLCSTFIL